MLFHFWLINWSIVLTTEPLRRAVGVVNPTHKPPKPVRPEQDEYG